MAVPRNRTSNAKKNSRRAHHAKRPSILSKCTNCGKAHRPHRACLSCGYYSGRSIVAAPKEAE